MALEPDFFDEMDTMPPRRRHAWLEERLRETVRHAYENAPATRAMLDRAGVRPGDIQRFEDLEKLPITRKTDVIELQKADPPYGGLLTIPPEEVERVFISPGPIYEPLHSSRIKWFARAFHAAGFRRGDVVVNTFTYHLSPAGLLFHEALRDCGATVVVTGVGNTDIQLQAMLALGVNGFVGTPSFLMTLIRRAEEMGYDFRRDFRLEKAWFTGEPLSPSVRQTLEDTYHVSTSQAYAVTEPGGAIAYECRQKSGMHMMDDYLLEIVDPETGRQLGPGEVGEVVVTPVHNPAWGLLRFGTGDLASYTTEPCPCGRTAHRLTAILGRTGDAVKVRGMFVVARQAAAVVAEFDQVERFQFVVARQKERDSLVLNLVLRGRVVEREALARALAERFQQVCRLRLDGVNFVPAGSIPEDGPTIRDERRWE